MMRAFFRLSFAASMLLLICCGPSLQGRWLGNDIPVQAGALNFRADADATFSGDKLSATISLQDTQVVVTAVGTYTVTDKQMTLTLSSLSGVDSGGKPVTAMEKDGMYCMVLVLDTEACVTKAQTNAYTIAGDTLDTTLVIEDLTFNLALKRIK